MFPHTGMSKKAYVEAVLRGIDSAIAECQQNVYVRYTILLLRDYVQQ